MFSWECSFSGVATIVNFCGFSVGLFSVGVYLDICFTIVTSGIPGDICGSTVSVVFVASLVISAIDIAVEYKHLTQPLLVSAFSALCNSLLELVGSAVSYLDVSSPNVLTLGLFDVSTVVFIATSSTMFLCLTLFFVSADLWFLLPVSLYSL